MRYYEPDSDHANARSLRLVQTALDKRLIAFRGRQTDASLAREQHLRRDELRALGLPET